MRARLQEVFEHLPGAAARSARRPAGSLSGGQQKQLEFAKAWLQQPRAVPDRRAQHRPGAADRRRGVRLDREVRAARDGHPADRPQRAPGRADVRPGLRAEPRAGSPRRAPRRSSRATCTSRCRSGWACTSDGRTSPGGASVQARFAAPKGLRLAWSDRQLRGEEIWAADFSSGSGA